MKIKLALTAVAASGFALALAVPAAPGNAGIATTCARHETVATGSSVVHPRLAKVDAELAWEMKVVGKYGPLWYSWWAAENNRFSCRTRGRRTVCVARGRPCRLL